MRERSATAIGLVALIALSGCSAMQERRWGACAVAGGLLGAGIGGGAAGGSVNAYEGGPGNDGSHEETAAAAAGGALVGGIVGALLGHMICDPRDEAPPPPPVAQIPPPPPAPPKGTKLATVGEAFFDFNKAQLKPSAEDVLAEAVRTLKQNPDMRVTVEGHADSVGSDAYNERLSEKRAQAVKGYLVRQGIESSRISTEGLGESKPVASNSTADGRAKNRRAEIIVQ
jgi:OOP family OmpA-OmpF porin